MKGGFGSLVWIKEKDGKEYVCYIDDIKRNVKSIESLTEEERETCLDVSGIVGTERW